MSEVSATAGRLHICAMPNEILLEVSQHLNSEQDALNWMSTCKRAYAIGQERLMVINAAYSGSGFQWAIINNNISLFKRMLPYYLLNVVYGSRVCIPTTREDGRHYTKKKATGTSHILAVTYRRHYTTEKATTPLILAIAYGRTEFVKYLLQAGANVNFGPLFHASAMRDLNYSITEFWNPIQWALDLGFKSYLRTGIQQYHQDIIKILLDHGANVTTQGEHYWQNKSHSPLVLAISNKCVSGKSLLHLLAICQLQYSSSDLQKAYQHSLIKFFDNSYNPIHHRFMRLYGRDDMPKLHIILKRLVDIDYKALLTSLGHILGRFLSNTDLLKCVEIHLHYMLQRDSTGDVLNCITFGRTVLTTAVNTLGAMPRHCPTTLSLNTARESYTMLFKLLLRVGASPDGGHSIGPSVVIDRPLMILCRTRQLWVNSDLGEYFTRFFVDHGAAIISVDWYGMSPLHWAASCCIVDAASLILDLAGSSIIDNQVLRTGLTPLMYVFRGVRRDHNSEEELELVKLFLRHGANVRKTDRRNRTVLHHLFSALRYRINSPPLSSQFYSANPEAQAFIYSTIKLLLDSGADVLHRSGRGESPLDIAESRRFPSSIIELMQNSIQISA